MQPTPQSLAEHAAFVRTLAQRLVGDPHEAEDLAQETWLAALRRPPRNDSAPQAWLHTVLQRFAWRAGRGASRRHARERAVARPERIEGADAAVVRGELLRTVTDAVLALDEPYQSTVLARFYEGLDAHALAAREGVPVATVRSRTHRALELLRARLDRVHGGDRRAWCLALGALTGRSAAPLAAPGGSIAGPSVAAATAVPVAVEALVMSTSTKFGLGVAGAALVGILLWSTARGKESEARGVVDRGAPAVLLEPAVAGATEAEEEVSANPARAQTGTRDELRTDDAATTGVLEGRVVWARDGRPAPEEEVRLLVWAHAPGSRRLRTFTDGEGRFRFEELLPGRLNIHCAHGTSGSIEVGAGETIEATLTIEPGFRAHGRVIDPDGVPVPGARLWLSDYFNYTNGMLAATTGADGSFELLDVPEARYLGALADGHAPSALTYLPDLQTSDAPQADVELVLTLGGAGGALHLRLVDPAGAPVARAFVRVASALPMPLRSSGEFRSVPTSDVWSDDAGWAFIEGLAPGKAPFTVYAAGKAVRSGSADIEAGRTETREVVLAVEGFVEGTVRTAAGAPVPKARVSLDASYEPMNPSATTDAEGRYRLGGLPAGTARLRAGTREQGTATTAVEIEAGQVARWDPVLDPGRVLSGRVVDQDGAPLAGWTLEASVGMHSPWRGQAQTDAEGAFRMADLQPGTLRLELRRDLFNERIPTLSRQVGEGETEILLRVERDQLCDAGLSGRVVDARGAPLPKAGINLWAPGSNSAPGFETDSRGFFRAEHLPAGTYEVTLRAAEGASTRFLGQIEIQPRLVRDLGTLVIEDPGRVRITVAGAPPTVGGGFDEFSFQQTDGEGNERWAKSVGAGKASEAVELLPGSYRLVARAGKGFANQEALFELRAGEEVRLDLAPRAGNEVHLKIRHAGVLPREVLLEVWSESGAAVVRQRGNPVQAESPWLLRLAPGTYQASATTDDGRRAQGSFEVRLEAEPPQVLLEPR